MNERRYNTFGDYLRRTYGERVHKVTLDAGFTCPNRDGTKGIGGCIYCDNAGFSANSRPFRNGKSVREQLRAGIEWARRRYGARKVIAYFQAYTNTYASLSVLKETYDQALEFPEVVGLDIGTRADCVDKPILDLIEGYVRSLPELWIEYGLQSSHDRTLERINRCDTFANFRKAVDLTRKSDVKICVHVILGLPGETRADMMATAESLADLPIHGIKIHLLHLLRGTPLVDAYERGEFSLLERDEYVRLVCDFLEILPDGILVHRLTGEAPPETLVAPEWCKDKGGVLQDIQREFTRRDTRQGCSYHGARPTSTLAAG